MDVSSHLRLAGPVVDQIAAAALSRAFLLLLAIDFMFIGAHLALIRVTPESELLSVQWGLVDEDGSLPEKYEAAKLTVAMSLLLLGGFLLRQQTLIVVAALVAYAIVDNFVGLHERIGYTFMPENRNLLEIAYLVFIGLIFLSAAGIAYLRSGASERINAMSLAACLGILAFFALVVDSIHAASKSIVPELAKYFSLVEDGGELIVMSLLLAVVIRMVLPTRPDVGQLAPVAAAE